MHLVGLFCLLCSLGCWLGENSKGTCWFILFTLFYRLLARGTFYMYLVGYIVYFISRLLARGRILPDWTTLESSY